MKNNTNDPTDPVKPTKPEPVEQPSRPYVPTPEPVCDYDTKTKGLMCRAVLQDDRTMCERIEQEIHKQDCLSMLDMILSMRNEDMERCMTIQGATESICKAITTADIALCEGNVECVEFLSLLKGKTIFSS